MAKGAFKIRDGYAGAVVAYFERMDGPEVVQFKSHIYRRTARIESVPDEFLDSALGLAMCNAIQVVAGEVDLFMGHSRSPVG
jgi:hypothetical protein